MLRPSYNEQITGFGFNQVEPLTTSKNSTTPTFGKIVSTISEVGITQNSMMMHMHVGNTMNVLTNDQGAYGVLMGLDQNVRECYTYSINGILENVSEPVCGFIGTLEATHATDTIQDVEIMSLLPTKIGRSAGDHVTVDCNGFCRPNILPSGYTNIANVTGLMFGMMLLNDSGSSIEYLGLLSFEIQRWSDPDVSVRTPVV